MKSRSPGKTALTCQLWINVTGTQELDPMNSESALFSLDNRQKNVIMPKSILGGLPTSIVLIHKFGGQRIIIVVGLIALAI